jgi:hypothetical protein
VPVLRYGYITKLRNCSGWKNKNNFFGTGFTFGRVMEKSGNLPLESQQSLQHAQTPYKTVKIKIQAADCGNKD